MDNILTPVHLRCTAMYQPGQIKTHPENIHNMLHYIIHGYVHRGFFFERLQSPIVALIISCGVVNS